MDQQILTHILEGRRSQPNQLIEVLQDVQEQYEYISREAMQMVSKELGVPIIEVFRVASFYKAFRLKPAGKHILTFCTGTACHVRGSDLLVNQATSQLGIESGEVTSDGIFSIERVNCLGACALGPIVVDNGTYYHHMTPARLRKLIESIYEKEAALKEEEVEVYAEIE
jgi:NADH:ubiquinone oxidoreductase subunit E